MLLISGVSPSKIPERFALDENNDVMRIWKYFIFYLFANNVFNLFIYLIHIYMKERNVYDLHENSRSSVGIVGISIIHGHTPEHRF